MGTYVYPPVSLSIAAAPTTYNLDGSSQVVIEDTVTPANNKPLPIKVIDSSGDVDLATEAKQDAIITGLSGKATETKQDAVIAALATVNKIKSVIASSYTPAPTVPTATRLATVTVPGGKVATELEVLTKAGDNFTAYDASTGGNVIGRFTQAGGRIPCNLVAATQVYIQSDTGSDFTATDLTINLIGVDA